ncbi:hypothetical protein [Leptolyngbya sp. PCC 6406]|uniref:hypothetical protein n=1 Tax=Leptolyngbya sp. PCC 6406 TaxID=1173264 RepID=UPI0002ABA850|nr:hypothetical protein [Leptolyngbya sp. PCC 6406]
MIEPAEFVSPSTDDSAHLSNLRSLVQRVMADGKISREEAKQLRTALFADGQLTPDELDVVRKAMREYLGDEPLEFDWD